MEKNYPWLKKKKKKSQSWQIWEDFSVTEPTAD